MTAWTRASPETVAAPAACSSLAPPQRRPVFSRVALMSRSGISLDRNQKLSLTLSAFTVAALACPGRNRANSNEATPLRLAMKTRWRPDP